MRNTPISWVLWGVGSLGLVANGCGELDGIDEGFDALAALGLNGAEAEPLAVSGHVLDSEGRPLWNVGVWLFPEEPGATRAELEVSTFTWPDGHYDIDVPEPGRYHLRFSASRLDDSEPLAVVGIDTRIRTVVDVALDRADVMSCRLLDGQGGPVAITSYALWTSNPMSGFGVGGGTGGGFGSSSYGPTALTFFWPEGYERVELSLGHGPSLALAGPDAPCDASAAER